MFALAGFALTVLVTNRLTVLLSVVALAITIAYPFFKRFFALPQAFLGIAFSFGIPMAFAAVQDNVPPLAWWLLAFNLFWVVAYDTEYAMVDRDDDIRLGLRTSAITFGRFDVARGGGRATPSTSRAWRGSASTCRLGVAYWIGLACRGRLRGLSPVAHPHPRAHALLPRVPQQSLARLRRASPASWSTSRGG